MGDIIKGTLACAALAAPAFLLGDSVPVVGGPIFGIAFGMALAPLWKRREGFERGIRFAGKNILQYAVILLGFGLNLSTVLAVGWRSLPVIVSTIAAGFLAAWAIGRAMRLSSGVATLIGVGSAICGGSAIAAAAPVIEAREEEVAVSISVIFLFNVVAALVFPQLGGLLGMSDGGFGLFAGTAVNDTSSVTAAASAWDGIHGGAALETATIVKLARTLAIVPVTLALAAFRPRAKGGAASGPGRAGVFPVFIAFFLLASLAATAFRLPPPFVVAMKLASRFFIVTAMAAIGLNADLAKLVRSGGRPILLGFCCWVAVAASSLAVQSLMGGW